MCAPAVWVLRGRPRGGEPDAAGSDAGLPGRGVDRRGEAARTCGAVRARVGRTAPAGNRYRRTARTSLADGHPAGPGGDRVSRATRHRTGQSRRIRLQVVRIGVSAGVRRCDRCAVAAVVFSVRKAAGAGLRSTRAVPVCPNHVVPVGRSAGQRVGRCSTRPCETGQRERRGTDQPGHPRPHQATRTNTKDITTEQH